MYNYSMWTKRTITTSLKLDPIRPGKNHLSTGGQRATMLHADGKNAFVNQELKSLNREKTYDYHGGMNQKNYEQWIVKTLVQNIKTTAYW